MERVTCSVEEAAQYLGIGRATAYRAVKAGEIPTIRIQGRILVPKARLEEIIAHAKQKGEKESA